MSLYLSNNEPVYGPKTRSSSIVGGKLGRNVQQWLTLYFPECKDKRTILEEVKNFIHLHFPISGVSKQEGASKITEIAIEKILRLRGFSTFSRPVQVRNGYVRKNKHLSTSELNQLPELERIVSLLQDKEHLAPSAISRILGIEIGQIDWLNYNTDCIIGERKPYQKSLHTFQNAGRLAIQAVLPIISGWRFDLGNVVNRVKLGVAFRAQLISWSVATLVFVGLLFSTWMFIQKEQKVPAKTETITKIHNKKRKTQELAIAAEDQKTQVPIHSKAFHAVIRRNKIQTKKEAKPIESKSVETPKLASTHRLYADFPIFPIRGQSVFPNPVNIENHEKIPIPLRQLQSKRKLKFRIGAQIQVTAQKVPVSRQISIELVAVKTIAFRKKICFGIKYLPVAYGKSVRVTKQFEQPNQHSKNVTDSVINTQSSFVALPITLEYELSPHFSVRAGLSALKRIHDYGETHTILKGPADGLALQSSGSIKRTADMDFAHFERESPFSNWGLGCHSGIQYQPSAQGNWLIRLDAMFGLLSKNKLYSISDKPPKLFWLGLGVSRTF